MFSVLGEELPLSDCCGNPLLYLSCIIVVNRVMNCWENNGYESTRVRILIDYEDVNIPTKFFTGDVT